MMSNTKHELVFRYVITDDDDCGRTKLLVFQRSDSDVCLEIRSWNDPEDDSEPVHPEWMDKFVGKKVKITMEVVDE